MRRTFAWALVVGMAGGLLAGCGVAPDRPASMGWRVQAITAQQSIALASINRAFTALEAAQAAALVQDLGHVALYLRDAQRHIENGNVAAAFPQRREAIQQFQAKLGQAIDEIQQLPALTAMLADKRRALSLDIIMDVQQALNRAENALVQ
jgi:enamine deaminase RidA (YjgF/YER057c/UK114 family)